MRPLISYLSLKNQFAAYAWKQRIPSLTKTINFALTCSRGFPSGGLYLCDLHASWWKEYAIVAQKYSKKCRAWIGVNRAPFSRDWPQSYLPQKTYFITSHITVIRMRWSLVLISLCRNCFSQFSWEQLVLDRKILVRKGLSCPSSKCIYVGIKKPFCSSWKRQLFHCYTFTDLHPWIVFSMWEKKLQ